ncbi:MAG: hypothetical protein FWD65_01390 [Coriobacteriia bacterium]|nr:hypothetical protein [Coriobacteriia bacterium]
MRKIIVFALTVAIVMASALMLTSCGSTNDAKRIQGTWKVKNSTQQLIITATQIKTVAKTFSYKLGASGKITITDQSQSFDAAYTLSKDGKTLTITETVASETTSTAQPQTSQLILTKISDSTNYKPQ